MQLHKYDLKSPQDAVETIAKKIKRDREKTPKQRLIDTVAFPVGLWSMLCAVLIFSVCNLYLNPTSTSDVTFKDVILVVSGLAVVSVFIIFSCYSAYKKGSIYASQDYNWIKDYLTDDTKYSRTENVRRGVYIRDCRDFNPNWKSTRLYKILIKWFVIYTALFGGLWFVANWNESVDVVNQILVAIGHGILFFVLVFAVLIVYLYGRKHYYSDAKYDVFVQMANEDMPQTEDD